MTTANFRPQSKTELIVLSIQRAQTLKNCNGITYGLGADAVIDFVSASRTVETDMQLLRRSSRVVRVGLFGGELRLNLVSMSTRAYSFLGSYASTLNDLKELALLARRGVIKPVVSDRFKLEQAS